MSIIDAAGMDETSGAYVCDECFESRGYDNHDDTNHDTDDDTDDGGRGNRRPLPEGAEFIS